MWIALIVIAVLALFIPFTVVQSRRRKAAENKRAEKEARKLHRKLLQRLSEIQPRLDHENIAMEDRVGFMAITEFVTNFREDLGDVDPWDWKRFLGKLQLYTKQLEGIEGRIQPIAPTGEQVAQKLLEEFQGLLQAAQEQTSTGSPSPQAKGFLQQAEGLLEQARDLHRKQDPADIDLTPIRGLLQCGDELINAAVEAHLADNLHVGDTHLLDDPPTTFEFN